MSHLEGGVGEQSGFTATHLKLRSTLDHTAHPHDILLDDTGEKRFTT